MLFVFGVVILYFACHRAVQSLRASGPLVCGAGEAAVPSGVILEDRVFLMSLGRQGLPLGHRGGTEMMVFLTESLVSRKVE